MSIGNFWLGSLQITEPVGAQNLATNSFNISTVAFSTPAVFDRFQLNVAAACTETLTVTLVPAAGSAYKSVLVRQSTSGITSMVYLPDRPINLYPGDTVEVNISNGNLTGQVYGSFIMLA